MNFRPAREDIGDIDQAAAMMRAGATLETVAGLREVSSRTLFRALHDAGYSEDTGWRRARILGVPVALTDSAGGSAQYVGARDDPDIYAFLPIREPVRYTDRSANRPAGLDWAEIRARYEARLLTDVPAETLRETTGKALAPRLSEDGTSVSTQTPAKRSRTYTARPGPRPKLTAEQQAEVIRRYVEDQESAAALGREFGVGNGAIASIIRNAGHPVRTKSEAVRLRFAQQNAIRTATELQRVADVLRGDES